MAEVHRAEVGRHLIRDVSADATPPDYCHSLFVTPVIKLSGSVFPAQFMRMEVQ